MPDPNKPWQFQPGHKLAKGGKREGAGRPSNDEREEILTLWQAIEREGKKRAARLANRYYEMAEEDPATMRHVVDGVRPRIPEQQPGSTTYQFIQFNNHHHTAMPLVADEQQQIEGEAKVIAASFTKKETWKK